MIRSSIGRSAVFTQGSRRQPCGRLVFSFRILSLRSPRSRKGPPKSKYDFDSGLAREGVVKYAIPSRLDASTRAQIAGVVIFGGGGHARSLGHVLSDLGVAVRAVVDVRLPLEGWGKDTVLLRGDDAGFAYVRHHGLAAVLGIGANEPRRRLARRLLDRHIALPSVVAATATVAESAVLGPGTVVLHHAHVGPSSRLGIACIVNNYADVEHDSQVGDAAHLAPGARLGGAARCGAETLVGTGAVIIPQVAVGARAVVGAQAAVICELPAGVTAVGIPARIVKDLATEELSP